MASILNADNGVVSGTSGLKYASDNSGVIELQTSGATTLTLNTSKNAVFANSANVTGVLNAGNTSITGTLTASANVNLDSGTLFVDGTNNRIGINNTTPTQALTVTGNVSVTGTQFVNGAVTFANSTSNTVTFATNGNIGMGTTTPNWQLHIKGPFPYIAFEDTEASIANTISTITGYQSGALYYDSDTNGVQSSSNAAHYFRTGGTTIASVLGTGVLDLPYGRIKFPTTQNASSDANTLDDYEEGSYTPTVIVTSGTPSYNYATAYYTKIGRQVFGGGIIGIGNSASLGGPIRVSLPFTALALTNGYTGGFSSDGSGWTYPISSGSSGNIYSVEWQINSGNAFMTFTPAAANAAEIPYTATGISNSWYIRFSFSFYTS